MIVFHTFKDVPIFLAKEPLLVLTLGVDCAAELNADLSYVEWDISLTVKTFFCKTK
jgi:hypothetical protein